MDMLNIQYDEAFIACRKYIKKDMSEFGAGVITSYDEQIEISEAIKDDTIKTNNSWLKVKIPARQYLLDMSKSVDEQSEDVKKKLFDTSALQILFHDDVSDFTSELNAYIDNNNEIQDRFGFYQQEMKVLYDDRIEFLKNLPSGVDLVQFVTSQTRHGDIEIASSFLSQYGILGSLYNDSKGERIMIFNPQRDIIVHGYGCQKID